MVCNVLHGKLVRLYYNCFRLCGIYVYPFLQFYLLCCYMQPMRARNEVKVNGSCNCQFCISNGFRNPNCDWYNIRYLSIIRVEASC